MRNPRAIAADAVPQVFDDACVLRLGGLAKLPPSCDLAGFGEGIRAAARMYARQAATPSPNELHREITKLHRLAEQAKYPLLAAAVEAMTPSTRTLIEKRRAHTCERMPGWRIPSPAEISDLATCTAAAQGLPALIEVGGKWTAGRMRPSGRRSRSWRPSLHAPPASRAEPRRAAERDFVMWLQVAVKKAGVCVPLTAHYEKPSPFARMVGECLRLIGATGSANAVWLAVQLVNELHAAKRLTTRACHPMNS